MWWMPEHILALFYQPLVEYSIVFVTELIHIRQVCGYNLLLSMTSSSYSDKSRPTALLAVQIYTVIMEEYFLKMGTEITAHVNP